MEDTPNCDLSLRCFDSGAQNTCIDSIGDQFDNSSNVMNYGCTRMFTLDQTTAMRNNLGLSLGLITDEPECGSLTFVEENSTQFEKFIEVFPNPNSGHFFLKTKAYFEGSMKVSIYDFSGQQKTVRRYEHSFRPIPIELNELNSGLYFLVIEMGGKVTFERVLVLKN